MLIRYQSISLAIFCYGQCFTRFDWLFAHFHCQLIELKYRVVHFHCQLIELKYRVVHFQ